MNFAAILPEIILTIGALVLMMVAAMLGRRASALCAMESSFSPKLTNSSTAPLAGRCT